MLSKLVLLFAVACFLLFGCDSGATVEKEVPKEEVKQENAKPLDGKAELEALIKSHPELHDQIYDSVTDQGRLSTEKCYDSQKKEQQCGGKENYEPIIIESCYDYWTNDLPLSSSTVDMSISSYYTNKCDFLKAKLNEKPVKTSNVSDIKVADLEFLKKLPVSNFCDFEEEACKEMEAKHSNVYDAMSEDEKASIKIDEPMKSISFDFSYKKINISESGRGNFDNSGEESIFVFVANYYSGGSGRYYYTSLVKRAGPDAMLVSLYKVF